MDTPDFHVGEFRCPCCKEGDKVVKPELLEALQRLRDLYQRPMIINSGYRCLKHNAELGGALHSAHLNGEAADIEDFHHELQAFCSPRVLELCGLWAEDYFDTPFWVHLQIRPAIERIFKKK